MAPARVGLMGFLALLCAAAPSNGFISSRVSQHVQKEQRGSCPPHVRPYVRWHSGYGFNNRVECFQLAVALAKASGRVVVSYTFGLDHTLKMRLPRYQADWNMFFEASGVEVVSDAEDNYCPDDELLTSDMFLPTGNNYSYDDFLRYAKTATNRGVYVSSSFAPWPAMFQRSDLRRLLEDTSALKFKQSFWTASDMLTRALPHPYAGVHLRLDDVASKPGAGCVLVNGTETPVADALKGLYQNPGYQDIKGVYVASDSPEDVFAVLGPDAVASYHPVLLKSFDDDKLHEALLTATGGDIEGYGGTYDPDSGMPQFVDTSNVLAILEMITLAKSKYFLPAVQSTLSVSVLALRAQLVPEAFGQLLSDGIDISNNVQ